MKYKTTRFGTIDLNEDSIIHFRDGLYGFEGQKAFARLPFDPEVESPLEWLQSLIIPELAFVITDPYLYVPDYSVYLTTEEQNQIDAEEDHSLLVRVIVTVPRNHLEMTANLLAPIVINLDRMVARQFVSTNTQYDTRHHLFSREIRETKIAAND